MMKKSLLLLLFPFLLIGCKSYEKVVYLQNAGEQAVLSGTEQYPIPDATIKVGDVLMITVNTNTPEAAVPFNLPLIPGSGSGGSYGVGNGSYLSYGLGLQNFLVDTDGYLTFPVIGRMKVAGMTKNQLINNLKTSIYPKYITEEPIILVRFGNFRISVLGEVLRPGSFPVDNEKVTILEALAMAGDMSIYGNRAGILLIREQNGQRETIRLDIRDKNLINSPYYYLQQNDVLYVEPNAPKQRTSGIGAAETLTISVVGTLISLSTLIINVLK